MDGADGSAGTGAERKACAPTCSCGLFGEGALIFHPPGLPGDHPGACAECGQAANLGLGCSGRAALAELAK